MVEDRFYEPETIPFDELIETAYDKYLDDMEDEEGEPMDREQFEDWYTRY